MINIREPEPLKREAKNWGRRRIAVEGETVPTYPSPKPALTLTSHVGQNVGLGEGQVGSFPETYNDPYMINILTL